MMKLFVLALFISVALCDVPASNVNALNDLALRLSFDIDAQVNITQKALLANFQASLVADIGAFLQSLQSATSSVVAQLQTQISTAQSDFQAALSKFVSQIPAFDGTVDGLALLVQQVGDAKAAIQLECQDLQQAAVEASAALKQSLAAKLQANLNENQKALDLVVKVTALQGAQLINKGVDEAQAAVQALLVDLSFARAQGQVYGLLSAQINTFVSNNTVAINKCTAAIQQRLAALALGITADWNTIKQQVSDNVADFKARVTALVKRVIGDSVNAIQVLDVKVDEATHNIVVTVSADVAQKVGESVDALQQRVARVLKAVSIAVSGGASVDVVINAGSKRQSGSTFQLTLQGSAQINLTSLGLAVQTDLSAAVSQYQSQVAATLADVKANFAAFQQQLATLTQDQIDTATAAIQTTFTAASQAWNDAKQAWNEQVTKFNTFVESAKQAILNAAVSVNDQVVKLLAVRKSQLDAKIAELHATVDQFKANLQSFALDEQAIKSAVLAAKANLSIAISAGNVDLQAQINASISVLLDTYNQKLTAAAIVQVNLDGLQGNLTAVLQKIQAEQADIDSRVQAFQVKLANTIDNIKARLAANEAQIKARIQELAQAIDANIQSVQATFQQLSGSVSVSVAVNFGANVTTDEVKAYLSAYLKAEFGTDNVVVTLKGSSKRSALASTANYEATVGPSDGSASEADTSAPSSSNAGLTTGAIVGIVIAAIVVVIIVAGLVIFFAKKNSGNDMRA